MFGVAAAGPPRRIDHSVEAKPKQTVADDLLEGLSMI
jgi:hypothetical protein